MLLGRGKGSNAAGFPDLVDKWARDLEYADFVGDGSQSLQSRLKDCYGNPAGTSSLKRVLGIVRGVFVLPNAPRALRSRTCFKKSRA